MLNRNDEDQLGNFGTMPVLTETATALHSEPSVPFTAQKDAEGSGSHELSTYKPMIYPTHQTMHSILGFQTYLNRKFLIY